MKTTAVFVDFENIRILLGSKKIDVHKIDFFYKLKESLSTEEYLITQMFVYDDFQNKYLLNNEYLKRFAAMNITPKHILHTNSFKNSADIELCLDALDISYDKNIETIVIVSSDKDMFPLVKKLKSKHKEIVLVGMTFNASNFVIRCSDKFIPVEEIVGITFDADHIVKQDIITATRRVKDLYEWCVKKKASLEKKFCIDKLKIELFLNYEGAEEIYNKLVTNNIVEEYEYSIEKKDYIGVKLLSNPRVTNIVNGKIPDFK